MITLEISMNKWNRQNMYQKMLTKPLKQNLFNLASTTPFFLSFSTSDLSGFVFVSFHVETTCRTLEMFRCHHCGFEGARKQGLHQLNKLSVHVISYQFHVIPPDASWCYQRMRFSSSPVNPWNIFGDGENLKDIGCFPAFIHSDISCWNLPSKHLPGQSCSFWTLKTGIFLPEV